MIPTGAAVDEIRLSWKAIKEKYTLSVFTENHIGLLNRITILFTRRHINIESITASESEVKGVYRYTVVVICKKEQVINLVKQIEKVVDVLRAFYHEDHKTVYQEIALYKVPASSFNGNGIIEKLVRKHNARLLTVEQNFFVIEKTGHHWETQALFDDLEPLGVLEFARSGRVSITRPMKELSTYLKEMEGKTNFNNN